MTEYEKIMNSLAMEGNFEKQNFEREQHLAPANAPASVALAEQLNVPVEVAHKIIHGQGNEFRNKQTTIDQIIMESAGDLNITVTRSGVTIDEPLPFVLFGLNDLNAGYFSTLSGFLPAGVTVGVSTSATGDIILTYTSGENVDTVTISFVGKTNYSSFLNALNQNFFKTKYIQYTISDETKVDQYNEMLNFGELSALGAARANQLLPRTRRRATDFVKDIIEILLPEQSVTPDFSIVQNIIAVDGFTIGFNVYMSTRLNANKR